MQGIQVSLGRIKLYLEWLKQKVYLDNKAKTSKGIRAVARGEVYKCNLGRGIGSEEDKERPCLIIQNNVGNLRSPNTIVAPITSHAGEPKVSVPVIGNYEYIDKSDNVEKTLNGYILLGNIVTVSKARLGQKIAILVNEMPEVNERILVSLGMYKDYNNMKKSITKNKLFIKKILSEKYKLENEKRNLEEKIKRISNT